MQTPQPDAEIVDVAAEHAPARLPLRAVRQIHGACRRAAIVGGGGVPRDRDSIGGHIGRESPGVLSLANPYFRGPLGRPADRRRLADTLSQFVREIVVV